MQQPDAQIKRTDRLFSVLTVQEPGGERVLRDETVACLGRHNISVDEENFVVAGNAVEYFLNPQQFSLFGEQNAVNTLMAALNACAGEMGGDIPPAGGKHRKSRASRKGRKSGRKTRASRKGRASRKQTKRR